MLKQHATETVRKGGSSESATARQEHSHIVEALAYQLWLQRGCPTGSDQEDWFEAERQLKSSSVRVAA